MNNALHLHGIRHLIFCLWRLKSNTHALQLLQLGCPPFVHGVGFCVCRPFWYGMAAGVAGSMAWHGYGSSRQCVVRQAASCICAALAGCMPPPHPTFCTQLPQPYTLAALAAYLSSLPHVCLCCPICSTLIVQRCLLEGQSDPVSSGFGGFLRAPRILFMLGKRTKSGSSFNI